MSMPLFVLPARASEVKFIDESRERLEPRVNCPVELPRRTWADWSAM
jgi:hypothetical protein